MMKRWFLGVLLLAMVALAVAGCSPGSRTIRFYRQDTARDGTGTEIDMGAGLVLPETGMRCGVTAKVYQGGIEIGDAQVTENDPLNINDAQYSTPTMVDINPTGRGKLTVEAEYLGITAELPVQILGTVSLSGWTGVVITASGVSLFAASKPREECDMYRTWNPGGWYEHQITTKSYVAGYWIRHEEIASITAVDFELLAAGEVNKAPWPRGIDPGEVRVFQTLDSGYAKVAYSNGNLIWDYSASGAF